ncbi:MAG: hypothetical protein EOO75_12075 [Myxococcales bacterium]|nr:MAG: hypothetical protein EOO75_12075 [Myxococcales bacterium]
MPGRRARGAGGRPRPVPALGRGDERRVPARAARGARARRRRRRARGRRRPARPLTAARGGSLGPVTLLHITIDDATLAPASDERRTEWRLATQELLEEHAFSLASPVALRLAVVDDVVATSWQLGDGELTVAISRGLLRGHLDEYVGICRRMGSSDLGPGSASLEALDMAKRVAHDQAGRTVQRLFKALGPDHPTARRLFTLLLTLLVDTSRLTMVHAHRPFRARKQEREW